jgi:hypothetical protein
MNSVLYTDHSSTIGGLNDKDSEMKDDGTYDNGNLVKVNTLNDDGFSNYKNQNELENKKTSNENIENNNNNSNTVSYEHSTPKDVLIGGSLDSLPYNSSICHDRLLCLTF